ncbi:MAG: SelL-related redox protein [Bythopirellula sp.]
MKSDYEPQRWMTIVLQAAGGYNLVWGAMAVIEPGAMLGWLGVESTSVSRTLWQCVGMMVGVYGVGYLIASRSPFRHWPITLIGLLGKLLGPIGFAAALTSGVLPATLGWTILANDVVWWIPFGMILWGAIRFHQTADSIYGTQEADDPLRDLRTNTGQRLDFLADQRPQLIVFLRHAGCTFCREAMSDLAAQREQIDEAGCGIILVHLGDEEDHAFFEQYGLSDVPRIADPKSRLYRMFGLDLGGFSELFGLRVWFRGIQSAIFRGHGLGKRQGNTFQMPGVFLYHCGHILDGIQHELASDRPDYLEFVQRNLQAPQPAAAG